MVASVKGRGATFFLLNLLSSFLKISARKRGRDNTGGGSWSRRDATGRILYGGSILSCLFSNSSPIAGWEGVSFDGGAGEDHFLVSVAKSLVLTLFPFSLLSSFFSRDAVVV